MVLMGGYVPLFIGGQTEGLVQGRQENLLPNDAYPVLENAFVWREQTRRRAGLKLLGRLQRTIPVVSWFPSGASVWSFTFLTITGFITAANNANPGQVTTAYPHGLTTGDQVVISGVVGATGYNNHFAITVVDASNFTIGTNAAGFGAYISGGTFISNNFLQTGSQPNSEVVPGSVIFTIGSITFTDQGDGTLTSITPGNSGTINYDLGELFLTHTGGVSAATTITYQYNPMFPAMGIRTREVNAIDNEPTIVFDTVYAYIFNGLNYVELASTLPVIWTGTNANFFWSTNYWYDSTPNKLFWVTNFSTTDAIRYYNGLTWTNFSPTVDGTNYLQSCLALLPFRGRLLAFNTVEGSVQYVPTAGTPFFQRIRWSAIGSPIASNSWNDTIRGQGGFLDIPTSENITAVGFVRDNLVVYCERSTWQLRYTGRSISPFQIERVNSELGAYSLFSAVQFDTSLVGIGDKGIIECDSIKSVRIDIKIPDLIFGFSGNNQAPQRVSGIRDIQQRVAYWSYVDDDVVEDMKGQNATGIYPNRRLVYNYENDSWAIFTDSLTCFGTYQNPGGITWAAATNTWASANRPWKDIPSLFPSLIAGNQQGFIMYLENNLNSQTTNDTTLAITGISGSTGSIVITSPNYNLLTDQVIQISGIVGTDPYAYLNSGIYGIEVVDTNTFMIFTYNPASGQFDTTVPSVNSTYIGGGLIAVRDGFKIQSKKFNFMDQGQNIQLGFADLMMDSTSSGAITMNVYMNYNNNEPINQPTENTSPVTGVADDFFNTIIPTYKTQIGGITGNKYIQRVYCATRAAFLTIEYTLSNAQLAGIEQESNFQIDSTVLWTRPAGRIQTW